MVRHFLALVLFTHNSEAIRLDTVFLVETSQSDPGNRLTCISALMK